MDFNLPRICYLVSPLGIVGMTSFVQTPIFSAMLGINKWERKRRLSGERSVGRQILPSDGSVRV